MSGKITLYTGPMFARKSASLFPVYKLCLFASKSVLAFKPKMDNRFGQDVIVSRDFKDISIPAINIVDISEILEYDAEVYIIDECQFLTGDVRCLNELADSGKVIYVAGLDKTAEGKPFRFTADLAAIADEVIKMQAICTDCREWKAVHSYYLGKKDEDIRIGDQEYLALCRSCNAKRMKEEKGIIYGKF